MFWMRYKMNSMLKCAKLDKKVDTRLHATCIKALNMHQVEYCSVDRSLMSNPTWIYQSQICTASLQWQNLKAKEPKTTNCISFQHGQSRPSRVASRILITKRSLPTHSTLPAFRYRLATPTLAVSSSKCSRNLKKTLWPVLRRQSGLASSKTSSRQARRPPICSLVRPPTCLSTARMAWVSHQSWQRWSRYSVIPSTGLSKVSKCWFTRNGHTICTISNVKILSLIKKSKPQFKSRLKNKASSILLRHGSAKLSKTAQLSWLKAMIWRLNRFSYCFLMHFPNSYRWTQPHLSTDHLTLLLWRQSCTRTDSGSLFNLKPRMRLLLTCLQSSRLSSVSPTSQRYTSH